VVVTITGLGADAFSYVYYDIYLTKKTQLHRHYN